MELSNESLNFLNLAQSLCKKQFKSEEQFRWEMRTFLEYGELILHRDKPLSRAQQDTYIYQKLLSKFRGLLNRYEKFKSVGTMKAKKLCKSVLRLFFLSGKFIERSQEEFVVSSELESLSFGQFSVSKFQRLDQQLFIVTVKHQL